VCILIHLYINSVIIVSALLLLQHKKTMYVYITYLQEAEVVAVVVESLHPNRKIDENLLYTWEGGSVWKRSRTSVCINNVVYNGLMIPKRVWRGTAGSKIPVRGHGVQPVAAGYDGEKGISVA